MKSFPPPPHFLLTKHHRFVIFRYYQLTVRAPFCALRKGWRCSPRNHLKQLQFPWMWRAVIWHPPQIFSLHLLIGSHHLQCLTFCPSKNRFAPLGRAPLLSSSALLLRRGIRPRKALKLLRSERVSADYHLLANPPPPLWPPSYYGVAVSK